MNVFLKFIVHKNLTFSSFQKRDHVKTLQNQKNLRRSFQPFETF